MDGAHRWFHCRNGIDLTVQVFSQTAAAKSSLNREHGNQKHDDQDHKKYSHRHENTVSEPRVIDNRNGSATVRAGFRFTLIFLVALAAPKLFHIKRLTRLIYRKQMDYGLHSSMR